MLAKPTVLHISYDRLLLDSRTAILQRAGYAVTPANSFATAIDALRAQRYDVVLVGHSLRPMDSRFFVRYARRKDNGIVAVLLRPGEAPDSDADLSLDVANGPQAFLEELGTALTLWRSVCVTGSRFAPPDSLTSPD